MRKLFLRRHHKGNYVGGREKVVVIGYNGHICVVITHLIETPLLELYRYVRILFESGIQVPIMVLRLRGRAIDLSDNFPPFMSRNGGVNFSWVRLRRSIK